MASTRCDPCHCDVAAIMAHADVRITAGIYARPSKENLTKALERIVGEEMV